LTWTVHKTVRNYKLLRAGMSSRAPRKIGRPTLMDAAKVYKFGPRIATLDGWRGISISLVVVGHLFDRRYHSESFSLVENLMFHLSIWGVNIFFVISGYIITKLALREYDDGGIFSVRNFYLRRFFRIIPPFFLYLGCIALASRYSMIVQPYSGIVAAATFTCNWPPMDCDGLVGHTWSLAYEEQFYVVFPALFALTCAYSRQAFAILLACLMVFPFVRYSLHLEGTWRAVAALSAKFSFICIGTVLAVNEGKIRQLSKHPNANRISGAVFSLLAALLLLNAMPIAASMVHIVSSLNDIVLPLGIAWLVGITVHQSNFFTRVLTTPPLLFIGTISYSLYLWQQLFTAPPSDYLIQSSLFSAPLMFVAATLSYFFVERYSKRLGARVLRRFRLIPDTHVT
jgi:peptidoglycan/LPS O-acetylase OafA/YrhL